MKSLLIKSVIIGVVSVSLADTQDESIKATKDLHDFMRIRVNQLRIADESEATAYHSDRGADVVKFLGKANRTPTADGEPHPFSRFPPPTDYASMKDAIRALPELIRNLSEADKRKLSKTDDFRLSEADDLPVWTGEAWVGGMPFILNGFDVGTSTRINLERINNRERFAGIYFYSKEERTPKSNFSLGELTSLERLHQTRAEFENGGLEVKFDKTFYIWRLVSTNKPVETLRGMYTQPQGE